MCNFVLKIHLLPMKRYITIVFLFTLVLCCTTAREAVYYDDHSGLSSNKVGAVVQDRRGLLWFATWNGLNVYDGYNFYRIKLKPGDGSTIKNDHISNMMLSPNGNLWCYAEDEVYEFDINKYSYKKLAKGTQELARQQMGKYWHRFVDRQDNIWMGYGKGVYKVSLEHHPAIPIEGTKGLHTRSLFIDKVGRLWVCTREDESVRIYDNEFKLQNKIDIGRKVYSIVQGKNGYVFMGCKPGGFMRILPISSGGKIISFKEMLICNNDVYDIQCDKAGRLWIATFDEGVKCCPNPYAENSTVSPSFGGSRMRKILITPRGNIIAAGSKGLLIGTINDKDYTKTKFRRISRDGNNPNSLVNEAIMDIVQDSQGMIYFATESTGIDMISEDNLFGKNPEFKHFYDDNSSLTSDFCRSLTLLNDTTLMVVCDNNMMLFNPKSDATTNYNHIFWNDTCHFAEGKPVVMNNGDIIFGTETGAYHVRSRSMYGRGYIPPLLVTYISVNGKDSDHPMPLSDTIHLAPNERNISIKFAALDLGENRRIMYRTQLDNSPWTKPGLDREVSLFDLEPGSYELRIQSTDRYGRWVNNICTVTIIVEPHWYETWWAMLIGILLVIVFFVIVGQTLWYIRKLKRQRHEALENYMALLDKKETPQQSTEDAITPPGNIKPEDQWFLDKIRYYIEENISNNGANIDEMAAAAATSRSTLNRRLNSIIGITAAQLLIDARMQYAARLLINERKENNSISVADIAFKCGYTDPKYFSRCFKQKYGVTPSEYNIIN